MTSLCIFSGAVRFMVKSQYYKPRYVVDRAALATSTYNKRYIDRLVQDCSFSIANTGDTTVLH